MKRIIFTALLGCLVMGNAQAGNGPDKWDYLVTISTRFGDMQVILYDETPKHKANFLKLVEKGFYDSLLFHRVIKDFMIQGGDPDSKGAEAGKPLGRGGPGYTIPAEFRPSRFHKKGAIAAARMGDRANPHKASSGSQFYLVQGDTVKKEQLVPLNTEIMRDALRKIKPNTPLSDSLRQAYSGGPKAFEAKCVELADQIYDETGFKVVVPEERLAVYTSIGGSPHLDDQYTVFGEVIVGLEIIDEIASVKTGPKDRPEEDLLFTVTAKRMKKKKITKLYGYQYE